MDKSRDSETGGTPRQSPRTSDPGSRPPEPAHRPVPGVKHVPEPDAENIMPAEDEPGTL